jgi:hypothetical protein
LLPTTGGVAERRLASSSSSSKGDATAALVGPFLREPELVTEAMRAFFAV